MGKRRTPEQYVEDVKAIHGEKYTITTPFINTKTKVMVLCNDCGHEWLVEPSSLLKGYGCRKCGIQNRKPRKTNDEFCSQVKNLWGNEYVFLDNYVNATTKIRCLHSICGTIWKVAPKSFLHNKKGGCPTCAYGKSQQEFTKEINNLFGDEYSFIEAYIGDGSKILCRHNICGYEWKTKPNTFLNGSRCPNCFGSKRKSTIQFQNELDRLYPGEYEVLGEYKTAHTKIKVRHIPCDYIWETKPNAILSKKRCSRCSMRKQVIRQTRPYDDFMREVHQKYGNAYIVDNYQGRHKKLKVTHKECGYLWETYGSTLLSGVGCPRCAGIIKTSDDFIAQLSALVGREYRVVGEYSKMSEKVKMKHEKCGYLWQVTPMNFIRGTRCPRCRKSHGELAIETWLNSKNCGYISQKKFADCKDQRPLPFDFYLPDYNLVIEYDGRQHFQSCGYFGGEEKFRIQHKHDLIKNKYCEDNNINLLRIPYTVTGEDIGKVIQNKLDELKQLDNVA